MDSPTLQSASSTSTRIQTHSSYTPRSSVDDHGAIQKRSSNDKGRSISTSQADRLFHLLSEQVNSADTLDTCPTSAGGIQWITPENSPQLNGFASIEPIIESYHQWTVPTPPRSDSGLPSVSIEEDAVLHSASDFPDFDQPAASEMSSLGFLLPSAYGASPYDSDHNGYDMEQPYMPPMRVSQAPSTGAHSAYTTTSSSEPALYISKAPDALSSRRQSELPTTTSSSYEPSYRRISSPYEPSSSSAYSMPTRDSILSISGLTHSPLPSPHMSATSAGHISPHYTTSVPRSPNPYASNPYGETYGTSSAPSTSQLYASSHAQYPPSPFVGSNTSEPPSKRHSNDGSIRVLNQRPKPQCWEHGCNGRQFSTFSNLLRHQREKSGSASKSYCPKCGAEFTRTTARNGHLAHDKCTKQQRRSSDVSK